MTGELFDATPYVVEPPDPDRYVTDGMGQDARRTARRRALIEDGVLRSWLLDCATAPMFA